MNTSLTFLLSKLDPPVIKTLDRIRFTSNQNIREGESNFDEKNVKEVFNLCSTEQSCINIGITCYKIGTLMHLLKISIFSLNNKIVRLTRIMNNLVKDLKVLSFKVIFQCLKSIASFQTKFSAYNLIRRPFFINENF